METYTNKVGAYRTDNNLGNNDRRKIGGCFNLWRGTERLLQMNTKSISKDRTPTNQTKSNENKTDRHRETDIETKWHKR